MLLGKTLAFSVVVADAKRELSATALATTKAAAVGSISSLSSARSVRYSSASV